MKSLAITRTKGEAPQGPIKFRVCKNPATKNMPHEEEYDDNNNESIDETAV